MNDQFPPSSTLAGLSRLAFEQILNERGIATSPQAPEELDRDLAALTEA
jgi:predicted HTH domain antitoxin